MFDFIPVSDYTAIYYHVLLIVTLYLFSQTRTYTIEEASSAALSNIVGYFFLAFVILYMGTRPASWAFGDMLTYADGFQKMKIDSNIPIKREIIFGYFTKFCAEVMDEGSYFLLIGILYITPCYLFARKYFSRYWLVPFVMMVGSFSFWPYGTNGLRNGMATSLFILALLFYFTNQWVMYLLMAIAYGFHNSLMIPIGAFVVSGVYKEPRIYLYLWLAAIPLSLIGGGFWEGFFGSLGLGDERVNQYLTQNKEYQDLMSSTGFRWDFVLYSASAVYAGYYYIIRKGFKDGFYTHLWGAYMIANAFWILVIRANFSNRFAYLSWFLMAIVIVYPLFKVKFWEDHYKITGYIFLAYYLFTYFMFLKS